MTFHKPRRSARRLEQAACQYVAGFAGRLVSISAFAPEARRWALDCCEINRFEKRCRDQLSAKTDS
jgi:hypothetical protein